jgi:hypothetical protein
LKILRIATLANTLYGMAASSDAAIQMLGMALLSLWNDPPPADNSVTLAVN